MVRSYVKLYSALSFCIALSVSPSVQAQVPSINKWMSGELAQGFNVGASIGMPSEKIVYFVFPMYDNEAGNAIDQVAYSTLNTDGTWSAPIVMKDPINDPFNNAVVGIDSSGTTLYLLGRYAANPRARIGLSSSSYSNGFWSSPTPVKLRGLNPTTEFYSLYVTPDQQLVFATFEKGREHSDDLFIATYNDEKEGFNKLQRLGAPINTKRSEIAPFYNLQDSTLYFSREVDSGDSVNYDLFYSKPLNSDFTEWSDPMPLETLNSPGFDAYYWEGIDGKAFFTSDRFNVGMTDILTYDARQKEMIPRTEELASDIGTGGEEQAMDETSSFSMVKILEKDEMLIDVSRWSDSASTFDLNIVLKDNQGVPIPEGETFIVRNEAGDVVREERIKENGAMQMKGLVVQPNLHFEIEDMASSDVQMEVLNRFGEVQSSLAILDAEQFVYRKLQYEQFAIELLLNSEDGEIPEDIVRSFLRGDVSSVSIDRSVAEDKGIVPHLTDLSKVILCNASGQRLIPIDVVEFIDRLGNVVERLSPIDNAFNYEDVKDVGATWLRINGNHIVLLSESVTYQSDLDAFGLTYFEIDDLDEIERIKGLIASDIGTGGEEQAMDETSSFSMVKILEKDEMLIDVSRWSDSASTFDLNIVLKDNQGVPIPEGETFIVRNEAGDVVREERIKENGAMQMKGLVVQPNLHFEIEDMASSDVQMEVLNRFGEVQSSLAILDAEQFVYRKLQYEQFAIELLLNSEDGEIPEDIVRSFLRGDVSSVSIDRSVAEDKGIVPHLTDLSKVILCNASGQRLIPIDVVEFIDRLGNVVERLSPIDNAFNYEDVKDVGATWLRINGNHIALLSESVTYQSDLDAFGLTYFEIDDLDEIERIKGLIASAQQEVSARIEDAENPTMHDSADVLSNVDRIETSEMDVLKEEGQDQGIAHEDDLMAASSRDTLLNGTPDNDSETVAVNEDSLEGESEQEAVLVATSSEMDRDDALSGSDMKIAASSDRTDTGEDVDFPGSDMKVADSSDRTDTGEDVNPSQEGDRDVSHGASDFYIDLHFGLNSHTIDTRTSMQLESLTTGKALSIQSVEGASDTIGPRAFNDDLALRRAQAVLGSLGQAGALEAVGVGEVATSPASNARRVRLGVAVSEEGLTKDGAEQRILIFHRFAQAEPDPEFLPLLSDIATFLTDHEGVGVKITSHTDYRGGAEYNMALSSKRADAVQGYLLERGVSKQQIKALWLGETQLYSGCEGSKPCDSHSLATDRRSELEFFKR